MWDLERDEIKMENIIDYTSKLAIPLVMLIIVVYGIIEKNKVFNTFCDGAKEGVKIVYNIFPTLIAIFLAVNLLRTSGLLEAILKLILPIANLLHLPTEILPLMMVRPISGSAATAVATDIMNTYGVDTKIGIIASVIMGATETTFYTIAIYTESVGIKNTRFVLKSALIADAVRNDYCNFNM